MNMEPNFTQQPVPGPAGEQPGKGKAIASLVLGIISLAFMWMPFFGLVLGIVGLVLAASAGKEGFRGGLKTAGFVCSLIGTIIGAFYLVLFIIGIALSLRFLDYFFFYF